MTLDPYLELLERALAGALPHVYRQLAGRHDQDKIDAKAWIDTYGGVAREARERSEARRAEAEAR
jgi:hypothetical protein